MADSKSQDLDDTPDAFDAMTSGDDALAQAQQEKIDADANASFEPGDSYSSASSPTSSLLLDPSREIGDPFKKTRTNRKIADALGLEGQDHEDFVKKRDAELAEGLLTLDENLFGEKGFYNKKTVNRSWQLARLAEEERKNSLKFATLADDELKLREQHDIDMLFLNKTKLGLNLQQAANKQDYYDKQSFNLRYQMEEQAEIEAENADLREKTVGLMSRIYKGLDHSLESSSGLFDLVDTETVWDKDRGDWVTREEVSGTGIAATAVAALGVLGNFALTVASEGKIPMMMDRLVFGLADRSLRAQKEKVAKYARAGEGVQTLYSTLLTNLSSEKAASNAYYALIYKRLESDYGKKASELQGGLLKNSFKIAAVDAAKKTQEFEMKVHQATTADARESIGRRTDTIAKAQTADLQWRSAEHQRLSALRDNFATTDELDAKYQIDKAPTIKEKENKWISSFEQNIQTASTALILIDELEKEYGVEGQGGYTDPDSGEQGGSWSLMGAGKAKMAQLKRKIKIALTKEHGFKVNAEYMLDEFGKMSAQRYGKNSDSGNQAVDELNFWIERFYTGEMSLSTVKAKIYTFLNDQMYTAASKQQRYQDIGSRKAGLYAGLIERSTNGVFGKGEAGLKNFKDRAFNATDRETLYQHYYTGMLNENPEWKKASLQTLQLDMERPGYEPSTYESIFKDRR